MNPCYHCGGIVHEGRCTYHPYPEEKRRLTHVDLFSGIGGFALAARWAGFETIAFCEIEPYCQKVLRKHWPEVPIHDDVRTFPTDSFRGCTLLTGGFPCQDVSLQNAYGAGLDGERSGLWRELARIAGALRPNFIVVENVAGLLVRGMGRVLGDLAALGYDTEWHCIPAAYVGAPQIRDRVWIVAFAAERRVERLITKPPSRVPAFSWFEDVGGAEGLRKRPAISRPGLCRTFNGVPAQVDRLRALGNAIVPQVAYPILKAIAEIEANP